MRKPKRNSPERAAMLKARREEQRNRVAGRSWPRNLGTYHNPARRPPAG